MIVIATHAVYLNNKDIYGPPHAISHYLNKKKKAHIFIKYPLFSESFYTQEYYENGKLVKNSKHTYPTFSPPAVRYMLEFIWTMKIVLSQKSCELFIGVDPLNAAAGNFLKKFKKVKRSIYFSADFALQRFPGPLMNNIYHFLDTRAMFDSSETWSVSSRIVAYRKKKGLKQSKNKQLPNAPFFDEVKRQSYEKIKPHDLVIVSALEKGIAFDLLLNVLQKISNQFANSRLIFIGAGSLEQSLKEKCNKLGIQKRTLFKGALSHEDMFTVLEKAGIGIALYDVADNRHFRYFSDPMKVRDYLAAGLPVIVSGNSSIGEELEKKKAGYVVTLDEKNIYNTIAKIFRSEKIYKENRKNAIELAREYDTFSLLEKYIGNLN